MQAFWTPAWSRNRRILLLDAPSVLGWEEWRAIDARYGFGLLRPRCRVDRRGRDRAPVGR
jgi:hypothetical protein